MRFKDLREQAKKPKKVQTKEIRLSPNIADGDLQVKINMARNFIKSGDRVKVSMTFRGRENLHKDIGLGKLNKLIESISDITSVSSPLKHDGSDVTIILSPKSENN